MAIEQDLMKTLQLLAVRKRQGTPTKPLTVSLRALASHVKAELDVTYATLQALEKRRWIRMTEVVKGSRETLSVVVKNASSMTEHQVKAAEGKLGVSKRGWLVYWTLAGMERAPGCEVELTPGTIRSTVDMTFALFYHHVRELAEAGLVGYEIKGNQEAIAWRRKIIQGRR